MEKWLTETYDVNKKEYYADNQERYNRTHKAREHKENICNARANWNSCDYLDFNKQEYSKNGCLCWKQDGKHTCCHCVEVTK